MHTQRSEFVSTPQRTMVVFCLIGFVVAAVVGARWPSLQSFAPSPDQSLAVIAAFGCFGLIVASFAADAIEARNRR